MSRRHKATKRDIDPDIKYQSKELAKFINYVMLHGKKTLAMSIVYKALDKLATKLNSSNPFEGFTKAIENARPSLEVRSRRIGGSTFPIPVEISITRSNVLGMRWIVMFARKKPGKNMIDGLVQELYDVIQNQGNTIKRKEDVHKMAESNKAFAHYRW